MNKLKKLKTWCLFDFGLSSYPTLILTFFFGAYYVKVIAIDEVSGTSDWGLSISISSFICVTLFTLFLKINKRLGLTLKSLNFLIPFLLLISCTSFLYFFNDSRFIYLPLLFIVISFVAFEVLNLFYNISLTKIASRKNIGFASNIGWSVGYLGGLLSLFIIWYLIRLSENDSSVIYSENIFVFIGPFVGFWTLLFCTPHFLSFKNISFKIPANFSILRIIKTKTIRSFIFAYFLYNNAVICIFAFASLFASILFNFSENEILLLGIFINLAGIIGCLFFAKFEDNIGSRKTICICIISLTILTFLLLFIKTKLFFWSLALFIGFFIGPIQASSRSYLSKSIGEKDVLSIFTFYSVLGNSCSIIGPFFISILISITDSIKIGLTLIPLYLFLSLLILNKKTSV
ncbi:MAG: hypothetical protein CMP41_03265 [Rickettsiales bacterium]|nr:hypothetical protein [Rickettsiales bacterium]